MHRVSGYEKIVREGVGPMKKKYNDDQVKGKFLQIEENRKKFKTVRKKRLENTTEEHITDEGGRL